MLKKTLSALLGIACLSLIPGCGIKGPLYLAPESAQEDGSSSQTKSDTSSEHESQQAQSDFEITADPDNGNNNFLMVL